MRKTTARQRVNTLERARKESARSRAQSPEPDGKRFDRMRKFTSSVGISDTALREAMRGEKDMSKVLAKLKITTPGQGASRDKKGFTGDGLYQKAPEPYNPDTKKLGEQDTISDFKIDNNPVEFRPVLRKMDRGSTGFGNGQRIQNQSVLQRMKSQELGNKIRDIQSNQPRVISEPYTFPDTDFDYDMLGAVQSSIANYKKKRDAFKVSDDGGVYTPISNQL